MLSYKAAIGKIPLLVILLLFFSFIFPLWLSPVNVYASFTDDFYYYLKIAQNFNNGQGLSFAPNIYTNGFQPFFQYFMVVLVYIGHLLGAAPLVFIRVVLALIFLCFSLLLLRELRPKGGVATLFFVLGLFGYYFISCLGMESLFIVPVLTYFVFKLSTGGISLYRAALLVMLIFFLRIDSFVITIPLFLYYFKDRMGSLSHPWKTFVLSGFIMGVPVAAYLLANYLVYGSFFPISGVAKTVTRFSGINGSTYHSFAFYYPYNLFNLAVTGLFVLIALTANFKEKIYFHLLALTVFLFYLQTSLRSDWTLWAWYFYPIPPLAFMKAAQGRALFMGPNNGFPGRNRFLYKTASVFTVIVLLFVIVAWLFNTFPLRKTSVAGDGKVDILFIAGMKLKTFEDQHAGVYAMGDRAGIVGYLMKSPLIQLEGLVMDKRYMTTLARANKIKDLLEDYNVDYYIASNPTQLNDSTYIVKEPFQSHGRSHQIVDTIGWKVCDSFTLSSIGVFSGKTNDFFHTVVFKVPKPAKQNSVSLQ